MLNLCTNGRRSLEFNISLLSFIILTFVFPIGISKAMIGGACIAAGNTLTSN
jgi:hypothetical protein